MPTPRKKTTIRKTNDPIASLRERVLDDAKTLRLPLSEEARLGNLVRLGRAIEKHRLKGLQTGTRQALRFLEGYAGSPEAARLWLAHIRARLQRGLGLRRLWWRLIGEARPRRATRGSSA